AGNAPEASCFTSTETCSSSWKSTPSLNRPYARGRSGPASGWRQAIFGLRRKPGATKVLPGKSNTMFISARAFSGQDRGDGFRQEFQIQPEVLALDVLHVQ